MKRISRFCSFLLAAVVPLACSITDPAGTTHQTVSGSGYPLTIYPGEDGAWGPVTDRGADSEKPIAGRMSYTAQGPFPISMSNVPADSPAAGVPPGMEKKVGSRIESQLSDEEADLLREEAQFLAPNPLANSLLSELPGADAAALGPTVGIGFDSLPYASSVPPDPELAVGPDHIIAVVNSRYEIYDKLGNVLVSSTSFDSFFAGVDGCSPGTFDPNVLYDEDQDRFILGIDGDGSHYCVAATQTGDPTGTWNRYGFQASSNFFDYPHAGVGDDAIYMGANIFAGSFLEGRVYAMDKFAMYAGTAMGVVTFSTGSDGTPQPMNLHGALQGTWPEGGVHYILTDGASFNGASYGIWSWDDPFGANTLTKLGEVNLNTATGVTAGFPVDQPQAGSSALLQANDWRVQDAEYRNGYIWMSHAMSCNPGSGTVNCVRWAKLDPAAVAVVDAGYLGTNGDYRSFPDLAADGCENMALGYTKTSTSIFPAVYVTGREATDPAGTLQAESLVKAGEVTYTAFDGSPHRWGDYTGMTIDPDGSTFWYLGEYSKDTGNPSGRYGTWVNSFTFSCVPPFAPPNVDIRQSEVSTTISGGDDDEFVDNCENASLDFFVRNSGVGDLTDVEIVSATPVSHPATVISTVFPIPVAATLAQGDSAFASFDFQTVDAVYGDTVTFDVVVDAVELDAPKTFALNVAQTETDLQSFASRTWDFESDLEDWTLIQGTFNQTAGGGANGSTGYLASSNNLNNRCDQVRSPEVYLTASSTLTMYTNYDIEPRGSQWWDQANVGIQDGGSRNIVDPDGGRAYNADGAGATCVTAGGSGWAASATTWASSSWSSGALGAGAYTGRPVHIDVGFGTDASITGRGFWFDQVTLTDFEAAGPDAQPDSCDGNTPPTVTITAPANGSTYTEGDAVNFTGTADDTEDGDLAASLSWTSSIDGEIGSGASFSTGTLSVGTHTITAEATDSGGLSDSDSIDITVSALPAVSIDSFTATPSTILEGGTTTLAWSVSNATACTASSVPATTWTGTRNPVSGSEGVTLGTAGSYTFTLSCTGDGDPASADVVVTVNTPPPAVIDSFTATPSTILEGGTTTLAWSVSNATACTASSVPATSWAGSRDPASGSEGVTLGTAGSYTFTLDCTGDGGGDSADVVVTVNQLTTLHVADLDGAATAAPRNRWAAEVTFLVHDGDENPASGVTVDASWIAGTNGGGTCVTDGGGRCSINKTNIKSNVVSVTMRVNDLTRGGDTYVPGDNHDPDGDSDGTAIIVYRDGPPGDQPPDVNISAPANGSVFTVDDNVTFTGSANDAEDGNLSASLTWTSSIDGIIGSGASFSTSSLSIGPHTITAEATDSASQTGSDSIGITVNDVGGGGLTITSATGYKVQGVKYVDLTWTNPAPEGPSGTVDISRNGAFIVTTAESAYTDNTGQKGGGDFTYEVCETGTTNCDTAFVNF